MTTPISEARPSIYPVRVIRLFTAPRLFARGIVGEGGLQAGVELQSDIIKVFLTPLPPARHVYL